LSIDILLSDEKQRMKKTNGYYAPTATTKRELKSVIIQYLKIFRYTVRSANGK